MPVPGRDRGVSWPPDADFFDATLEVDDTDRFPELGPPRGREGEGDELMGTIVSARDFRLDKWGERVVMLGCSEGVDARGGA